MRIAHRFTRLSFCLLPLLSGCSQNSPAPEAPKSAAPSAATSEEPLRRYSLHGQVQRLDPAGKIATVKHQAIGDWMGAMTMEFPVRDPAEFAKIKEGASIEATVFVQGTSYWIGDVQSARPTDPASQPK